jgi:hypothetical protein
MRGGIAALLAAALSGAPAFAQSDSPVAQPPAAIVAPPAPRCEIPAGTVVSLALVDPLSSSLQKTGDKFRIRLAEPIMVGGQVVVAAGAEGVGEVIDAAPPKFGGRAGKLVLAARYIESGGARLPLQSFKIGVGGGKDYSRQAMVTAMVASYVVPGGGMIGLAVHGGNVDWPAGAPATAKLSSSVTVTQSVAATPAGDNPTLTEKGSTQ